MKKIITLLTLLIYLGICNNMFGQNSDSTTYSLRVIVDGIIKKEGTLVVGVANEQQWNSNSLKECNQKVAVTDCTMELNFDNLKAGEYAIIAFVKDDINDQRIRPLEEQTGFSQNIKRPWKGVINDDGKLILSNPNFEEVKFRIPQKRYMRIVLGNPSKSVEIKERP